MTPAETLGQEYARYAAQKWGVKEKAPKGVMPMCKNCKRAEFHQWVNGNIKDPMVCQCGITAEWNVIGTPAGRCDSYAYDKNHEKRLEKPVIHQKHEYSNE